MAYVCKGGKAAKSILYFYAKTNNKGAKQMYGNVWVNEAQSFSTALKV